MSAANRRLMSCRCRSTFRFCPSKCRSSRWFACPLLRGTGALPQATNHSANGTAPLLQLGDDLAQCHEGKAPCFLPCDAALELRLAVPSTGKGFDDSRGLTTVQVYGVFEIGMIGDRRQRPTRTDVVRQLAAEVIVEVTVGQPRKELASQPAKTVTRSKAG